MAVILWTFKDGLPSPSIFHSTTSRPNLTPKLTTLDSNVNVFFRLLSTFNSSIRYSRVNKSSVNTQIVIVVQFANTMKITTITNKNNNKLDNKNHIQYEQWTFMMNSLLKASSLQVFFVQAIESGGPKPQTS